jgi:hypothetical protein
MDRELHINAANAIKEHLEVCTTHVVLVIDQSGSMKTHDVADFKNRSEAAYGTIALELLGKRLDGGHTRPTDVVSVIEMSDTASVLWEREPITNVLYNKFVARRLAAGSQAPRARKLSSSAGQSRGPACGRQG